MKLLYIPTLVDFFDEGNKLPEIKAGINTFQTELLNELRRYTTDIHLFSLLSAVLDKKVCDKYSLTHPKNNPIWESALVDKELWESTIRRDDKLAEDVVNWIKNENFSHIIINTSFIPNKFLPLLRDELPNCQVKLIIHDVQGIDHEFGLNGDTILKSELEWSVKELTKPSNIQLLKYKFSVWNNVLNFNDIRLTPESYREDIKNYLWSLTTPNVDIIFPSSNIMKLFRNFTQEFNMKWSSDNRLIQHFLPKPFLNQLERPLPRKKPGVIMFYSWYKMDFQSMINVTQLLAEHEIPVYLVVSEETKYIADKINTFRELTNLTILDYMNHDEIAEFTRENVTVCYHPTMAFESFGYIPWEMKTVGVTTIVPYPKSSFTGIVESPAVFIEYEGIGNHLDRDELVAEKIMYSIHNVVIPDDERKVNLLNVQQYANELLK